MFEDNGPFQEFRAALEARGVHMRRLWEADRGMPKERRKGRKGFDVAFVEFIGDGFTPQVGTAVIIDYGPRDGFGFYTYFTEGGSIEQDADFIATPLNRKSRLVTEADAGADAALADMVSEPPAAA